MVLGGSTVADAYFKRDENHQGEAHLATATCTDSQEQEAVRICTKHLQKEDTLDSEAGLKWVDRRWGYGCANRIHAEV